MRADLLVGVADRHGHIEDRLEILADIEPLRLAADEHRKRLQPAYGLGACLHRILACRFGCRHRFAGVGQFLASGVALGAGFIHRFFGLGQRSVRLDLGLDRLCDARDLGGPRLLERRLGLDFRLGGLRDMRVLGLDDVEESRPGLAPRLGRPTDQLSVAGRFIVAFGSSRCRDDARVFGVPPKLGERPLGARSGPRQPWRCGLACAEALAPAPRRPRPFPSPPRL